jgi:hypothetical protein
MDRDPRHDKFWSMADRWIAAEKVEEGTMMGHHCLRARPGGGFVATVEKSSGDLIVKLPRQRVDELIESGSGRAFAPAGKIFKEWVAIPIEHEEGWEQLLEESVSFVTG